MAEAYLGEIRMFAGNFGISGWQMCNGQTLSIQSNTALFSIIGTYYGGNGTSTFQLPNFQGRVPIHQGTGPGLSTYVIGEFSGTENVTLLYNNMPIHNHSVNVVDGVASAGVPQNNFLAKATAYSGGPANGTMNPVVIGTAGGNVPINIIQPYLCVTFLIAVVGIFPSRN
jgi:microcystin-dependent protein